MATTSPTSPARSRPSRPRFAEALLTHLKDPMRRSAYALIAGTGITSGLGLLFWALAARWLDPVTVGLGAAAFTSVAFLANVSTLGMRNGLIRFLPAAGSATRRLVITVYAVCAASAVLVAGVFLLGQPWWAEKLGFLRSGPLEMVLFALAVCCWMIFILQDNVLVAFRRAIWIPIENAVCSIGKIAALPLVAGLGGWAVLTASVVPAALGVLVITVLVLRQAGRAGREAAARGEVHDIPVSRLVRFAATDHFAALIWMGTTDMLTLLVLHRAGAESSAYYFMASTVAYTLYLITSNVGSALIAEGAHHPDRAVALTRQSLLNAARLVLPAGVVGVIVAPWVLRIFGENYAANGTLLLQLLLVSAVPQMIVGVSVAGARIRHDLRLIIMVYSALAVGVFGGSSMLIGPFGLTGVGLAALSTQTVVAVALLVSGRTGLWVGRPGVRALLTEIEQVPLLLRRRRSRRAVEPRLGPALAAAGLDPAQTSAELMTSDSDSLVLAVDGDAGPAVLKIATTDSASRGLERHTAMISWLSATLGERSAGSLLPTVGYSGQVDGHQVVLESRMPGSVATRWLDDPRLNHAAYAAVADLHEATRRTVTVDVGMLRDWIETPLARLARVRGAAGRRRSLDRLGEALYAGLAGRTITGSWTHGDYWPGNVLVVDEGLGPRISGIVDFENSGELGVPDCDLLHWWLTEQPGELGARVVDALADEDRTRGQLEAAGVRLVNSTVDLSTLILLTWLWHIAGGLVRAEANRLGLVWLARNVWPVVQRFDQHDHEKQGVRR